jgi:hypothetical protein
VRVFFDADGRRAVGLPGGPLMDLLVVGCLFWLMLRLPAESLLICPMTATIPLDELGAMLLHPSTPYWARDRAVRLLFERSRRLGGPWTVGLAGVVLPGMRRQRDSYGWVRWPRGETRA